MAADGARAPLGLDIYGDLDGLENTTVLAQNEEARQRVLSDPANASISDLLHFIARENGGDVDGRYILDPEHALQSGGQAQVAMVTRKHGSAVPLALKFFNSHEVFELEKQLYCLLVGCQCSCTMTDSTGALHSPETLASTLEDICTHI